MNFSNESEAVLGLISLVLSADQVATSPERSYVFNRVAKMPPFRELDRQKFSGMLSNINEQLFGTDTSFDNLMQQGGLVEFCNAFKTACPETKIEAAFQMACEIAYADGLLNIERSLLDNVGSGLGLSKERVSELMMKTEVSYAL